MPIFKVTSTITFEIDSESLETSTKQTRRLLDGLAVDPTIYFKVEIKTEVIPIKVRVPSIVKLRDFSPEEVFAWLDEDIKKKEIQIGDDVYLVNIKSDRHHLFKRNPCCSSCGIIGKKFVLESKVGETIAHLNFYAQENGKDILMTKDHIKPKSYGGADTSDNLATCCFTCNQLKSSFPISYHSVKVLRDILRNPNQLPTRELRKLITKTRLTMLDHLDGQ